ncbi:hypothetical protein [Mesorhizobium sp. B4-1-4]|uniref:hypothetical protein n=1 Tax=Mesorhizobium sp. B4-1-4 TaxID=2589888 RepID=UPI001D02E0C4|nr:hypothetical protein [Mesorhizobium sp. B4-1-4]UCI30293.1 hypothetical protein FJW03_21105 [Mesorhizobium sp. B4-1-4]
MPLTVADMNRLEQAARISMGEFLDPETSAQSLPAARNRLPDIVALALVAAILLTVLFQFT